MNKIIAIVGMPGSGKGTITDYLESKGYPKIYFGGMVYDEVEARGLDIVKDEKFVREDMRAKEGMAVMAKRAAIKADEYFAQGKKTVVFDGLYSWSEWTFLNEKYGSNLTTIAVFTDKNTRYERFAARNDGKRKYTVEDAARRDKEEIENIEKGGPIAAADYTLLNNDTPENLLQSLDNLLSGVL